MAKSKKKAETVFLVCEETGDYNYSLRRKPGGEKLKLKKYSPRLRSTRSTSRRRSRAVVSSAATSPPRVRSATAAEQG